LQGRRIDSRRTAAWKARTRRAGSRWNERKSGQVQVGIRASLHTGECDLIGDDIDGIAVRIVARVAAKARPGEVLVSRMVRDLVAGSGIGFEDRGRYTLKGVPGKFELYAAVG
jgi:class 3 adenylate cyclase